MTPRAWFLFVASSVIWGIPYLFIKIAVDGGMPPGFVAWSRVAVGAVLLLPIAVRRGALRGITEHAWAVAAYAACEIAVPFVLIAVGEKFISSSLAAILVATMPLLLALLAVWFAPAHRPTGLRLFGLVVGLSGVIALLGIDVRGHPNELYGAIMVLGGALCYAAAPLIVSRYLTHLDPMGPVAASLVVSSIALLPAGLLHPLHQWPSSAAVISILVLGIVCTVLGLIVFFQLIAAAGPSRASIITYVNPVVAVVVGVLTLHERVGGTALIGLALILGGSWLAAGEQGLEPVPD